MNIQEEREYILAENNTAQERLIDILDTLSPGSATEIHISEPLSGEIDFSVLNSLGFKKIKTIYLGEGKITDISHIPNTVSTLVCAHNILISLENLPESLLVLDCSHNNIKDIDLKPAVHLTNLNCAFNRLTELKNISDSIEELYCDDNEITRIDLFELVSLRILHCSNNRLIVLENLPTNLHELRMENNPMAEIQHNARTEKTKKTEEDTEMKIDYLEGLREYFRLKQKYEKKQTTMKRDAFKRAQNKKTGRMKADAVRAPCINCARNVGTVFAKKDDKYIALCGDISSPCNLNIQIYKGYDFDIEVLLVENKKTLDESKEHIIRQKLDTIFNYLTEKKSAILFKKEMDNYNNSGELYKEMLDKYNNLYNNMHKRELFRRKMDEIYEIIGNVRGILDEYQKTGNREILKTAVQMQKDDLIPKTELLQKLKYEVMEMDDDKLVQRELPLSKLTFSYGEPAHIMKFTRK